MKYKLVNKGKNSYLYVENTEKVRVLSHSGSQWQFITDDNYLINILIPKGNTLWSLETLKPEISLNYEIY